MLRMSLSLVRSADPSGHNTGMDKHQDITFNILCAMPSLEINHIVIVSFSEESVLVAPWV